MITINSSDFIKKPSYITKPEDITFVKDAKKQLIKSVVIPYELYNQMKEKIEDELYLIRNQKALSKESYDAFLAIEEVVEDKK